MELANQKKLVNIALILIFLVIFSSGSCSPLEKKDSDTSTEKNNTEDSTLVGCKICILDRKISDLKVKSENYSAMLQYYLAKNNDDCYRYPLEKTKDEIDSLENELYKIRSKFDFTVYEAETHCSKKYPIHFVKNEKDRDSILMELYLWNQLSGVVMDTLCRRPEMENGKYKVFSKGKQALLTEEQYQRYLAHAMEVSAEINSLVDDKIQSLTEQLTGIENPDMGCREIMYRYALYNKNEKYRKNPFNSIAEDDPDLKSLKESQFKIE